MAKFGAPYMGSKSSIVRDILKVMPAAENFYDLFGGGGCVTHCAALEFKHKWENIFYNEIKADVAKLIQDAVSGKYAYEVFKPEWISREDFHARKSTDAYVRLIWSFGNNQKDYMFGLKIETQKKSLHQAVVFGEFDSFAQDVLQISKWPDDFTNIKERRLWCRRKVVERKGELQRLEQLERLERLEQLERLQQLEQLERLQQLQQLERLFISATDYADVLIKPNSVIYCDIPYHGTVGYGSFDRARFIEWAATHKCPVFVSEYLIDDSRLTQVFEKEKVQRLAANTKNGRRRVFTEKLYANTAALALLNRDNLIGRAS